MSRIQARTHLVLALLGWLTFSQLLSPNPLSAQSRDERAVRAAYLFNLIKFVEWPHGNDDFLIGFVGSPATGDVMRKMLDGKASDSRVIRVLLNPPEDQLKNCSVVYIDASAAGETRRTLDAVKGKTTLTVGETDAFAKAGGMVGLVNDGGRIQIETNLEATQSAGIRISSRVLSLAIIVRPARNERN